MQIEVDQNSWHFKVINFVNEVDRWDLSRMNSCSYIRRFVMTIVITIALSLAIGIGTFSATFSIIGAFIYSMYGDMMLLGAIEFMVKEAAVVYGGWFGLFGAMILIIIAVVIIGIVAIAFAFIVMLINKELKKRKIISEEEKTEESAFVKIIKAKHSKICVPIKVKE